MFNPNTLKLKNISYLKRKYASFKNGINVDYDENLLPIKYSTNTYNYDYTNGALRDGIGINAPIIHYSYGRYDYTKHINTQNKDVHGSYLFNFWSHTDHRHYSLLLLYCGDGKVYYNVLHMSSETITAIPNVTFTSMPKFCSFKLNGVDTLIMTSETDGMYTWTPYHQAVHVENAPQINNMCIHNERLFVTTLGERRSVWFSDDLDPTNFNLTLQEGGFIEMADDFGKSNKVVTLDGYLYVIRDFNIARIIAYADQKKFTLQQIYVGNSRIYENTVAVCGDKIYYLASDGLYVFNGSSAKKVKLSINKMFDETNNYFAVAGYINGHYYLACNIHFNDEKIVGCENSRLAKNNALIKINVQTGELNILRGYDVRNICAINDLYDPWLMVSYWDYQTDNYEFCRLDMSGTVLGVATSKEWQSPYSDFGYPDREKLVKEITLYSKSDCKIEVCCDGQSRIFEIQGKDNYQTIRPKMKGKRIALNFKSNVENTYISNPQIVVGLL